MSIIVTPAISSVIASRVNPSVVQSSMTVLPAASSTIAEVTNPAVILGSVSITPSAAECIATTTAPTVLMIGSVTVSPATAWARARTIDPTVLIGVLVIPAASSAIASTDIKSLIAGDVLYVFTDGCTSIATSTDPTVLVLNPSITDLTLFDRSTDFNLNERGGFYVIQHIAFENGYIVGFEDSSEAAWGAARAGLSVPARSTDLTVSLRRND